MRKIKPDIRGEMDEIQRFSQDLMRDEDIKISVKDIVNTFKEAEEVRLTKNIWSTLENTESNEIKKGDFAAVEEIAKTYDKTDPKILVKAIKSGQYKRPFVVNWVIDTF